VTPICLVHIISETARDRERLGDNGAPIGNGYLGIGYVTDDVT